MMNGWVTVQRTLAEKDWYKQPGMVLLYIHLLMKALDTKIEIDGLSYPAGSVVTSIRQLANETGLSIQMVRTCLQRLAYKNEIKHHVTRRFSVISICGYECCNGDNLLVGTLAHTTAENHGKEKEKVPPHTPLYKEKEELVPLDNPSTQNHQQQSACAHEEFLGRFLSQGNCMALDNFARSLHNSDPDISSRSDLTPYINEIIASWTITGKQHQDYTDWSSHMMNTIRKIITSRAKDKKHRNELNGLQQYALEQRRRLGFDVPQC